LAPGEAGFERVREEEKCRFASIYLRALQFLSQTAFFLLSAAAADVLFSAEPVNWAKMFYSHMR